MLPGRRSPRHPSVDPLEENASCPVSVPLAIGPVSLNLPTRHTDDEPKKMMREVLDVANNMVFLIAPQY